MARFIRLGLLLSALLGTATVWAAITGSISGVVTDPSGAVVPGLTVVATSLSTNVKTTAVTDSKGFYSFPTLNVDTYDVTVSQRGFRDYLQTGVKIDANSALRDRHHHAARHGYQYCQREKRRSAGGDAVHAEWRSHRGHKRLLLCRLNGRSYIDLLKLQPGVSPYSHSQDSETSGVGATQVSGDLDNGQQSVNGGRTGSNAFMVNGANAEEGVHNGAAMIPNLDSIAAVPHHHQQLRCRVWKLQRWPDQCSHQVGNQSVSRHGLRLPAQH